MKKIRFILIILILIYITLNFYTLCIAQEKNVYIIYFESYSNGKFYNVIFGDDIDKFLDFYKVKYTEDGKIIFAEKYISGSMVERLYFYNTGSIKIRETYETPQYSEEILGNLTYKTDNSPNTIFYYNRDGELIGTQEMEEYLYARSLYEEGQREYYSEFHLDYLLIMPEYVFGEKLHKGIAKRIEGCEVIYTDDNKINRIEVYIIEREIRRTPTFIYDFLYNQNGYLKKIRVYSYKHGKVYFNFEYIYFYDDFGKVTSRHKILYYSNLSYIEEVIRYRYKGSFLKNVSEYFNYSIPFQEKELTDKDFRLSYDSSYEYNRNGFISNINYKMFLYRSRTKNIAYDSIEKSVEFEYTENNKLKILTEYQENALYRVIHNYYDDFDNIIRKEKIFYKNITLNENITYEYYQNGRGPLKLKVRDSYTKRQTIIEYYLSEGTIGKMEIYNSEDILSGVFEFNYAGDIIEEIKYGGEKKYYDFYEYYQNYEYYELYENYKDVKKIKYDYYDNGTVFKATIYKNDVILKVLYFSEEPPFLYGEVVRIDYYINGEIYVTHFYFNGVKIKSIFYKNGEVYYVNENPE